MKLKSIKKRIWSIVIIITTLIGILPAQANTTETPVKDVELDGRWDDPIRSAATNCPITVFTDGYLLTVKNVSPCLLYTSTGVTNTTNRYSLAG